MAEDEGIEAPVDAQEEGMGTKAKNYFDNKNKNALAGGVASATTDTSLITQWLAQTVFSAINLGSHVSASTGQKCYPTDLGVECVDYSMTRADKWTTSVESVSLAFALLMTLGHWCCMKYATKYVMGKMPEGIVAFIVLAFVAAGMPAIMNPANEQALNADGSIRNANLYFFSWAGLAVAVYVFCTWLFHHCFKKQNLSRGSPTIKWYLLLAASVIVIASACRLLTPNCGADASSSLCRRTKYGVTAGAIGTFCALVVSVLSFTNHLSFWPETISAVVVFLAFIFAIAFLTFGGADAPAANVGNLYFSTWICFILGMFVVSKSFKGAKKRFSKKGNDEEKEGEVEKNADEEATPEIHFRRDIDEEKPEDKGKAEEPIAQQPAAGDVAASF